MKDTIDLEHRDPNDHNDHVQVKYEDILAEPDGAWSEDCVWELSFQCLNCGKGCIYKLLTLVCSWWLALAWGCSFAVIAVRHVWVFTPILRLFSIECGCLQKLIGTCLNCCGGYVVYLVGISCVHLKTKKG